MITLLDSRHLGPHACDQEDGLVARDERRLGLDRGQSAVGGVYIGVAETGLGPNGRTMPSWT